MTVALGVDDLRVAAGELALVRGVSFALAPGEALTILGESGSGKSLMAQAIMGTLPPELASGGSVTVDGTKTPAGSSERARLWGRRLALLPQEPWLSLDPTMRVVSQVAEGYPALSARTARGRAGEALARLGLADAGAKFPFMLSGGMAQRVAFAAAEAGGAGVLIVDEPTKGLDDELRGTLVAMLRQALDRGQTLVTVTHDIDVARALGGTIAVMLDGVFVEAGAAEQVIAQPAHDYTRRLIDAQPARWPRFAPPSASADEVLAGTGLAKRFGDRTLFRGVDLAVPAGGRVTIAGASGSGKTTLGNMLLGLVRPDSGRVVRQSGLGPLRFQKLYQDPPAAFVPGLALRTALADLVARHGLDGSVIAPLMASLGLSDQLLDRRPDQVSGGELQRFAMLRVLLLDPVLIFADEPTSRLDPIIQRDTIALLVKRCAERGTALLLVTHDRHIAASVGDRTLHLAGVEEPVASQTSR